MKIVLFKDPEKALVPLSPIVNNPDSFQDDFIFKNDKVLRQTLKVLREHHPDIKYRVFQLTELKDF